MRLAIVTSHPIQYYSPLFRELGRLADVHVFFAHRATPEQQARAGFGVTFDWDVDLLSGIEHTFLTNVSAGPSTSRFSGCDTPDVGDHLRKGFDVVLVTGWNLKTYWQAILAARRAGVPVMVRGDSHLDTQRDLPKRLAKAILYPLMLRSFAAILYTGRKNRAYLEHYLYPASRLFFAPIAST